MDRIVDALGRGENVVDQGTDDPLFELLVRARNEAGASIPPAPLVDDLLGDAPLILLTRITIVSRRRPLELCQQTASAVGCGAQAR